MRNPPRELRSSRRDVKKLTALLKNYILLFAESYLYFLPLYYNIILDKVLTDIGMIRQVKSTDAQDITDIYNKYILHSTATFETAPLSFQEMRKRIDTISSAFPFFVYETEGHVTGYAYAHLWKERAAYRHTWETTVYVMPQAMRKGVGTALMNTLVEACKSSGCHALVACITGENTGSISLHRKLGFKQVSSFKEVGLKFGKLLDISDFELIL